MSNLTWTCDACAQPVHGDEGYIHVDDYAARQVVEAREQDRRDRYERAKTDPIGAYFYSLTELRSLPQSVPWQVHHRACDPRPDTDDYWFAVERAATHADLLHWTAHLMGKNWLSGTAWDDFIRKASGVNP